MTGLMDKDDYRYCGNLRCNFTIEPCLLVGVAEMTDLEFRISSELFKGVEYKGDLLRTYSNEKLTSEFEINYFTEEDIHYYVYFNSSNSVFLEVSTYPSNIVKEIVLFRQATLRKV
uniref:Uncharacterized protein n=1 Tax=Panagrolaimus davidi TaxID=227884 RepID=A0A914PB49_9BILA